MVVDVKTMEVKKGPQLARPAESSVKDAEAKRVRFAEFFGEVKAEFKKISWTSAEELKAYTKIVVLATIILGMGIYVMDLIIQLALNVLAYLVRIIS